MGLWGQGKMGTHQQKKLDDEALREFRNRFALPLSDEDVAQLRFYHPGPRARDQIPPRAPPGAGWLVPARTTKRKTARAVARRDRAQPVHDDGVRAASCAAPQGREAWSARRADRRGRGAHVRYADAVPAGRHLFRGRPALRARRPRRASLLPRSEDGQILEEGSPRPARSRRGSPRRPRIRRTASHASVLHLLLHLRLPARRRSHLGRGRLACAWFSGRRHGRPHHARRRRAPAPGRLVASHRRDIPELPGVRPVLRLRARRDRRGRGARMLEAQEDVFYYLTVANENYPHPAMPKDAREESCAACTAFAKARRCSCSVPVRSCAKCSRRPSSCKRTGTSPRAWSVTSFTELRRDGMAAERTRRLGGQAKSWVETCLDGTDGPVIAASDYVRRADLIRGW